MASARMNIHLLCFLIALSLSVATSKSTENLFDEPVCSKYHFEEEVLKKLVRLEFELEKETENHKKEMADMKIQMDSLKDETEKDIRAMEGNVAIQMDALKDVTEKDIKAIEENVETKMDALKDVTEKDIKAMEENIDAHVKGNASQKSATESVSFLARNPPTKLPNNDVVVFSTTVHNVGGHYNVGTGKFTAPVTGTYLFSTQLCTKTGYVSKFQLVVNNNVLGVSEQQDKDGSGICSSMVTVGQLTTGQQAWVNIANGGVQLTPDSINTRWNMFVGVLIAQTSD